MTRKIEVSRRIEQLPTDERNRARELYAVLDRIERLTMAPFQFGILAVLVPILLFQLMTSGNTWGRLAIFFMLAPLSYAALVFILRLIIFNQVREKEVNRLKEMLSSDHRYRSTLTTLEKIDPAMAGNIQKCIARASA